MQQIRGWVRPPISVCEITAIWSRPALEECCSCRYITAREAAKRASGTGEAVWTWAGWAGKGSGSGSHQGFAKWWWVMSAVWGGEGIMADWEYRGSLVHTILIHSYQKKAKRCLLCSWRGLHITHVLLRLIKQCWDAFGERCCCNFQRGEDDSHYISKYHFEIPPKSKASEKQHKRAAKRDF